MSIIALASNTLAASPGAGQIEYNGQFYGTDSNSSRGQLERITQGTAVSASGTSVDFTGIPAWAKKITVMFSGVSTSGTSPVQVQIGDSGGIETTGYVGVSDNWAAAVSTTAWTGAGCLLNDSWLAANVFTGTVIITNISTTSWIFSGTGTTENTAGLLMTQGRKALSDTLTQVRITTVNGTDTFDAGTINIIYEG